jgi:AraC family transcriptional regulator
MLERASPRPTLEEWFVRPPIQVLSTSESLGWNNITAFSIQLNATQDYTLGPATPVETLNLTLAGSSRVEGHRMDGRYFTDHMTPGSLNIVPRFYEMDGRWESSPRAIFMHISRQLINSIASDVLKGDPEQVQFRPLFSFYDPFLRHLSTELYHELENMSLFGPLFAESVANTIALHLLRKYANVSVTRPVPSGRLTAYQLQIINDYIHAHLDLKISLADLADCLHISVPHFEKMFRATLHCPPYRYVLECRIDRAKQLLSEGRLSLSDVAHECGFANQSHLTRHFSKFVGVSPARFMQSMGVHKKTDDA